MFKKPKKIMVTGGAGYIGSHTVLELKKANFEPIIVDNFSNSKPFIIDSLEKILEKRPVCYKIDCTNKKALKEVFKKENIYGVIHFAALKSVLESINNPLIYYNNNISSLAIIIELMHEFKINNLVFSSSCTVYGEANYLPIDEFHPLKKAESPYGYTKQVCENMITDCLKSNQIKQAITLRYFNPIGAHSSGLIGELPIDRPNNLIPFINQTAAGIREYITIFGNDYKTQDGTCIRDYIHVMDLAKAHVCSLLKMEKEKCSHTLNIGTGVGHSVLDVILAFEKVNNLNLKYRIGPRRKGDISEIYASTNKAEKVLKWKAEFSLKDALKDAWNWQKKLMSK